MHPLAHSLCPPSPALQFIDDMQWNVQDCAKLGVCAIYAPRGLTADAWSKGLAEFARRQQKQRR